MTRHHIAGIPGHAAGLVVMAVISSIAAGQDAPPGRRAAPAAGPRRKADRHGDPLPPGAVVRLGTIQHRQESRSSRSCTPATAGSSPPTATTPRSASGMAATGSSSAASTSAPARSGRWPSRRRRAARDRHGRHLGPALGPAAGALIRDKCRKPDPERLEFEPIAEAGKMEPAGNHCLRDAERG